MTEKEDREDPITISHFKKSIDLKDTQSEEALMVTGRTEDSALDLFKKAKKEIEVEE